jgi:hypothetical protein
MPGRPRVITPPPEIVYHEEGKHYTTPQRSAVFAARLFSQALNVPIPCKLVHEVIGVCEREQRRILESGQVRTLHNIPDSGPDPRGRKRTLTREDTAAISDYLCDKNVPREDRGAPWLDIAEAAGVPLGQTWHFKPPGYRDIETDAV